MCTWVITTTRNLHVPSPFLNFQVSLSPLLVLHRTQHTPILVHQEQNTRTCLLSLLFLCS
uniref:Uncharacterized protein n=1 Tax=Triticum urartu TaxID=4572 RepID=A0A8R7TIN5_TRIUA